MPNARSHRVGSVWMILAILLVLPGVVAAPVGAQSPDPLERRIGELEDSGRFEEATALAERYVAFSRARYGERGEATALNNTLAGIYERQGRFSEAEAVRKRALAIIENTRGSRGRDDLG